MCPGRIPYGKEQTECHKSMTGKLSSMLKTTTECNSENMKPRLEALVQPEDTSRHIKHFKSPCLSCFISETTNGLGNSY